MKDGRIISLCAALLAALALLSLCIGSYPLPPEQIVQIVLGQSEGMPSRVFWQLRAPRVLVGAAAGAALSLAGAVYQTIFRNALASPDLTGVASGASFGAACAIVLGSGSAGQIMLGSFTAGMASLLLVLALVRCVGSRQLGSYLLSGVIVSALADAGLMCLKIMADPERELAALEFWTMGSLSAVTAPRLTPQLFFILTPMALLLLFHRQTVLLALGAENARSMGLDAPRWRAILLTLTTLMVASLVSLTGVIAFVGLLGPHIAFLLRPRRDGRFFLLSCLLGASLLLIADMLARSIAGGAELPLSILTVFLAVPVLIVLLRRRNGGHHADA